MENNENNENNFGTLITKYAGAIIGGLVALILCFTELYKLLLYVVIILAGGFCGDYVQKNKAIVKEKIKEVIDKF